MPEIVKPDRKTTLASKPAEFRAGYVRALRDVALQLQEDHKSLQDSDAGEDAAMAARFVLDLSMELQREAESIEG